MRHSPPRHRRPYNTRTHTHAYASCTRARARLIVITTVIVREISDSIVNARVFRSRDAARDNAFTTPPPVVIACFSTEKHLVTTRRGRTFFRIPGTVETSPLCLRLGWAQSTEDTACLRSRRVSRRRVRVFGGRGGVNRYRVIRYPDRNHVRLEKKNVRRW